MFVINEKLWGSDLLYNPRHTEKLTFMYVNNEGSGKTAHYAVLPEPSLFTNKVSSLEATEITRWLDRFSCDSVALLSMCF